MQEIPIVSAPPIPGKYDIIPIHASDVGTFLRCRRAWQWSSPSKLNLRRKVHVNGVNTNLWYGTGVHYALEEYYDPFLSRDPVETFKTWFHVQWYGGVVEEEWLERVYDLNPEPQEDGLWKVRGLNDILPDPNKEEFEELLDLGIGMLTYYKDYAERRDNFVPIAAESKFSVPLGFEALDTREESPNYGKMLEVHARGTRDAIIWLTDVERFAIIDHKTAASTDDDYFTKLELDPQVSTYWWASQVEAQIHDLPYTRIDRCLYNVLLKKYPKPPTILSDGFSPSINRKEESTTHELFAEYIDKAGLRELYYQTPKWQSYYNWLFEQGEEVFIKRRLPYRNQHQIKSWGEHLKAIAQEMVSENLAIYPNPKGDFTCTRCQFRAPCLAAEDGGDYVFMLSDGYELNQGR